MLIRKGADSMVMKARSVGDEFSKVTETVVASGFQRHVCNGSRHESAVTRVNIGS